MKEMKELTMEEWKQIYRKHLKKDFPGSELRPFSSMRRLAKDGRYVCYGYYEGECLLGYACFILTGNRLFALLDYFAVVPELRDRGVGSEFLRKLRSVIPAKSGAFIEVESPESAKSDDEKKLRQRRVRFYLSNGAEQTDSKCLLFGVDYNILFLTGDDRERPAGPLHPEVEKLYRELYRPVYMRLCRPYAGGKKIGDEC